MTSIPGLELVRILLIGATGYIGAAVSTLRPPSAFGCAVVGAEDHLSQLQSFADGKLGRTAFQDLSRDLECGRLDDCSRQVMNLRDRHVATVSHGAEQIACEILHHW